MRTESPAPVLVTGGTGFIGSHLVERLVSQGCRVRCLVRRKSSLAYLPTGRIELAYGDLANGEGLPEAVQGARVIYHLAGVTKANSPARYYQGNAQATRNLLRAAWAAGPRPERLVHVSSLAAAGPSQDGTPIGPDAEPHPLTHYGRSKLEAEEAVRNSPLADISVILRPPVVYGPRDTDVYEILKAAVKGISLRIGRQESYFSHIYVEDLAEALIAAAGAGNAAGKTYFVNHSEVASWSQFSAIVAGITGRKIRTVSVPAWLASALALAAEANCRLRGRQSIISREKVREARCRFWVSDSSRAFRDLGFRPHTTLEEGIRRTLAWYKYSGWLDW